MVLPSHTIVRRNVRSHRQNQQMSQETSHLCSLPPKKQNKITFTQTQRECQIPNPSKKKASFLLFVPFASLRKKIPPSDKAALIYDLPTISTRNIRISERRAPIFGVSRLVACSVVAKLPIAKSLSRIRFGSISRVVS